MRKLRPGIEKTLEAITMILFVCIAMIDDFTKEGLLIIAGMFGIIAINTFILCKFGHAKRAGN